MSENRRTIFRTTAFERYVRRRDRVVLVRYVAPGALAYVWVLLGVLVGAALLAALAPIPEHAAGTAVILSRGGRDGDDAAVTAAVLVPARYASRVQVGQAVTLRTERGRVMVATVQTATGEVVSPSDVQRRFGTALAAAAREPDTVAVARLTDDAVATAATAGGAPLTATVQVGHRPAWTLLVPSPRSSGE